MGTAVFYFLLFVKLQFVKTCVALRMRGLQCGKAVGVLDDGKLRFQRFWPRKPQIIRHVGAADPEPGQRLLLEDEVVGLPGIGDRLLQHAVHDIGSV